MTATARQIVALIAVVATLAAGQGVRPAPVVSRQAVPVATPDK